MIANMNIKFCRVILDGQFDDLVALSPRGDVAVVAHLHKSMMAMVDGAPVDPRDLSACLAFLSDILDAIDEQAAVPVMIKTACETMFEMILERGVWGEDCTDLDVAVAC